MTGRIATRSRSCVRSVVALTDPLLVQLAERLSSRDVSASESLAGGASSLQNTQLGQRGNQRVVVKAAPPGVPPIAHRDVLRQARIIRR